MRRWRIWAALDSRGRRHRALGNMSNCNVIVSRPVSKRILRNATDTMRLNNVKPEAQPLRQHDRAQPDLKVDVRVRRDDGSCFFAGLGVACATISELRRELAPPRAADVHVGQEALLQSGRYFFFAEFHFDGLLKPRKLLALEVVEPGDVCGEIASGAYIAKRRTPDTCSRS